MKRIISASALLACGVAIAAPASADFEDLLGPWFDIPSVDVTDVPQPGLDFGTVNADTSAPMVPSAASEVGVPEYIPGSTDNEFVVSEPPVDGYWFSDDSGLHTSYTDPIYTPTDGQYAQVVSGQIENAPLYTPDYYNDQTGVATIEDMPGYTPGSDMSGSLTWDNFGDFINQLFGRFVTGFLNEITGWLRNLI